MISFRKDTILSVLFLKFPPNSSAINHNSCRLSFDWKKTFHQRGNYLGWFLFAARGFLFFEKKYDRGTSSRFFTGGRGRDTGDKEERRVEKRMAGEWPKRRESVFAAFQRERWGWPSVARSLDHPRAAAPRGRQWMRREFASPFFLPSWVAPVAKVTGSRFRKINLLPHRRS